MLWLQLPVQWQQSRIPDGYNYSAMTPEEQVMLTEKFLFWYQADWDYALTTIEFLCAGVAACVILNVVFHLRAKTSPGQHPSVLSRLSGLFRYFVARQLYVRSFLGGWYSPPLGAIITVIGVFIFVMALMLGKRPYYWPNEAMGESMPIATRSGWIAIAIMPFMIALSTKINYVAFVTGTSHEKVQVFHRWLAIIMYIPSLVHTFPFIQGSIKMGMMQMNWNETSFYWTGVAALVPQTYLVFTSWGVFRNPQYEFFKKLHFIAAAIFMAALFLHVSYTLSSWDYFWATLAIYASAWLFRVVRTIYNSGFAVPAYISMLNSAVGHELLQIRIPAPAHLQWSPGQHVFVRFWGLEFPHAFSSHPWTIASLPGEGKEHSVDLVLRVHGGITKTLARRAQGKTGLVVGVWVDGPYGGVPGGVHVYDDIVLLAGGSGSTFIIPLLVDLGRRKLREGQTVTVVISLRTKDDYSWMEPALKQAQSDLGGALSLRVHLTGDSELVASTPVDLDEKSAPSLSQGGFVEGRPSLAPIISEICVSSKGRVGAAACGPESLLYDVRNEIAQCQMAVAKGLPGALDIFLHTENYSW